MTQLTSEKTDTVEIEVSLNRIDGQFNWQSLFDNANPVETEIGIGKGRFLIESALENPHRNYLGIEWAKKYLRITKQRVEKRGLTNVRLVHGDARYLFEKHIPRKSLHAVHVFFPDPWPKKRHHKRRIFQPETCRAMENALQAGGYIEVRTDFYEFYEQIEERFAAAVRLKKMTDAEIAGLDIDQTARTNYERKYRKEGREIYTAIYQAPLDAGG